MERAEDVKSYKPDQPIQDSDVQSGFKYEVAKHVGAEGLLRCLKCGACSGGCPVAAVTDYRARKVLGDVLLGLKDQVLSSDTLWLCAACFTCEERCVQEVNFTDVVTVLRNMAVREGFAAEGYVEMAKRVIQFGRVSPLTRQVEKMRENLKLPPLQEPAIEELQAIMESAGFPEIMEAATRRSKIV